MKPMRPGTAERFDVTAGIPIRCFLAGFLPLCL